MVEKQSVIDGVVALIRKAETILPEDVVSALRQAALDETGIAKIQLDTILKNIVLAKQHSRPLCQDTGLQTFFVSLGVDSPFRDNIESWVVEGVKQATKKIPLRPNTVEVFSGMNPGDNTGDHVPIFSMELITGDHIDIVAFPKGAGSENMSCLRMLNPSEGVEGIKKAVVDCVVRAGGKPCPPLFIGVGIGGTADLALSLGRKALFRPIGSVHNDPFIAQLEKELIQESNLNGCGPMGLGGKHTVLSVHIETAFRHPASLPVGVVLQCWAHRHAHMCIDAKGTWAVF